MNRVERQTVDIENVENTEILVCYTILPSHEVSLV